MQVRAVTTRSDADSVRQAFRTAWLARFGKGLPAAVESLLLALSHFETGGWLKMFNHNAGNIVLPAHLRNKPGGPDHFTLKGDEGPGTGSDVPEHHYRAYESLAAGAGGLIAELTSDKKPQWREGLLSGDPETFVAKLGGLSGGPRYYEADPKLYLSRFMGRYKLFPPPPQSPKADPAGPGAPGGYGPRSLYWRVRRALSRFGAGKGNVE